MSRLIAKNLPSKTTEKELKSLFAKFGTITDCSLKLTANGKSRNFAFIGFSNDNDAQSALKYFNNSYIGSSKINVELSRDLHNISETKNKKPTIIENVEQKSKTEQNTYKSVAVFKAPPYINKSHICDFFNPLPVIGVSKGGKQKMIVEFGSKKDAEQALRRTNNFLGGKKVKIKILRVEPKKVDVPNKIKPSPIIETQDDEVCDSGRLFVRNLAYVCTTHDLELAFSKFGKVVEILLPVDPHTNIPKGYAFLTYMFPTDAVTALNNMDGSIYMGRMLHIIPAHKPYEEEEGNDTFEGKTKKARGGVLTWNTLFLAANAVADTMANQFDSTKSGLVGAEALREKYSVGVRMALGETQLVIETRKFLLDHGVALDCFSQVSGERSKTVLLVKNLPTGVKSDDIITLFKPFATINRVIFPPSAITAIIEFASDATSVYRKLAYSNFRGSPLFLEWAPVELLPHTVKAKEETIDKNETQSTKKVGCSIFVKNLNFLTTSETLREVFGACGEVTDVTIAQKISHKEPGVILSAGYGFVMFARTGDAHRALRELQLRLVDDHSIELKLSERAPTIESTRENAGKQNKCCNTLMVRNIPFQARRSEINKLFCVFGEVKSVRLPRKVSINSGDHRGFAFVDFTDEGSARRAMDALCHSTHLYGRRLVIEYASPDSENVSRLRNKANQQQSASEGLSRSKKRKITIG